MPRRKSVNIVRDVGVDPLYGKEFIQKFINVVMWRGKKNAARRLVYGAIKIIEKRLNGSAEKAVEVFDRALQNCIPLVEVRARRIGGGVYQIPVEVSKLRGRAIAIRSLVNAANEREGNDFSIKLANELSDAADGKGGAIKAKFDKHKQADANKTFSHLSW